MVRQTVLLSRHQIGNFQPSAAVNDRNAPQWIIRGSRHIHITYTRLGGSGGGRIQWLYLWRAAVWRAEGGCRRLDWLVPWILDWPRHQTRLPGDAKRKEESVKESRVWDAARTCPGRSHTLHCRNKVQVRARASGSLQCVSGFGFCLLLQDKCEASCLFVFMLRRVRWQIPRCCVTWHLSAAAVLTWFF